MARQRSGTPKRRPSKAKALQAKKQAAGYQFKITLPGTKPLVWRRFQVPEGTLGALHDAIQIVMGWENAHLHSFVIGKQSFTMATDEVGWMEDCGFEDEDAYLLRDVIPAAARQFRFRYEYDFGDSWEHELVLEKRLTADETPAKPVCLEGENACPPEDVGGIWGFEDMKEAIKDKSHERYDEFMDWGMEDYDPTAFSVEGVNKELKRYWKK